MTRQILSNLVDLDDRPDESCPVKVFFIFIGGIGFFLAVFAFVIVMLVEAM